MQPTLIACQGVAGHRLLAQMATVLDPLAARYIGATETTVRSALREAWRAAFGVNLPEPSQSRCVAAITAGYPWQIALWSND